MLKLFKSPERVFAISMWAVSLVFASFLLGLGGKIIADIPSATRELRIENFMPPAVLQTVNTEDERLREEQEQLMALSTRANQAALSANNDYTNAQNAHQNWLSTRSVTSNNPQSLAGDKELEARTRGLDKLSAAARLAQSESERINLRRSILDEKKRANDARRSDLTNAAKPAYASELRSREFKVFGLRLLLTLSLLASWITTCPWIFVPNARVSTGPLPVDLFCSQASHFSSNWCLTFRVTADTSDTLPALPFV